MKTLASICFACGLLCAVGLAQDMPMGQKGMAMDKGGVIGSYVKQAKFVEGQFISLAKAIPQDKYAWRPEEGVRSISESFMHAALGNYIVLQTLGGKMPEGFDMKTYETSTTDKDKIVTELQKSFKALGDHISKIPEKEYSKTVKFFGMDMTKLDMIFLGATHQHETLGQAIAYARTNHITPPWTAAQQAREKGKQPGM